MTANERERAPGKTYPRPLNAYRLHELTNQLTRLLMPYGGVVVPLLSSTSPDESTRPRAA
jgi:hypothetical protein